MLLRCLCDLVSPSRSHSLTTFFLKSRQSSIGHVGLLHDCSSCRALNIRLHEQVVNVHANRLKVIVHFVVTLVELFLFQDGSVVLFLFCLDGFPKVVSNGSPYLSVNANVHLLVHLLWEVVFETNVIDLLPLKHIVMQLLHALAHRLHFRLIGVMLSPRVE